MVQRPLLQCAELAPEEVPGRLGKEIFLDTPLYLKCVKRPDTLCNETGQGSIQQCSALPAKRFAKRIVRGHGTAWTISHPLQTSPQGSACTRPGT